MKIICDKFIYDPETELNEVNYFSPTRETTTERLDLVPYLMEGGITAISYPKVKIDETNAVYIESGDVTLTLTNTLIGWGDLNNYTTLTEVLLTDFFGFYTTEKAIFEIKIYDSSDNLLFTGIIRKYNLVFSERSNEVMSVLVRGLEKEFSNYFLTKEIIRFEDIPNFPFQNIGYYGLRFSYLSDTFNRNLSNVVFDYNTNFSHFIHEYIMAGKPYIYHPCNNLPAESNQVLILKSGYESFYYDRVDAYTFFNSTLISMGWKWYFKGGIMHIDKRSDNTKDVQNIPFSDILSHSIENELNSVINTVVVDNGEWYGWDRSSIQSELGAMNVPSEYEDQNYNLGGGSKALYNVDNVFGNSNVSTPFRSLILQTTGQIQGGYYDRVFNDYAFVNDIGLSNEESLFLSYFFLINATLWLRQYQNFIYKLSETISFNPYVPSGINSSLLDVSYARINGGVPLNGRTFYGNGNAHQNGFPASRSGIYYRGNPGSAMLKRVGGGSNYQGYDYYVTTDEFKNNLRTLTTGGDATILNVTVTGLINDFDKIFSITDYPYANFQNKLFTYSEISLDVLGNTTSIKLTSIN